MTDTTTYLVVEECNDWEGETWFHCFKYQAELRDLLFTLSQETRLYEPIGIDEFTEEEEGELINKHKDGYMCKWEFGEVKSLEALEEVVTDPDVDLNERFYKGRLRDYLEPSWGWEGIGQ